MHLQSARQWRHLGLGIAFLTMTRLATADALTSFEQQVRQWLELRQQISRAEADWHNEQQLLEDELAQARQQLVVLEAKDQAQHQQLQAVNAEHAELVAAVQQRQDQLRQLDAVLAARPAMPVLVAAAATPDLATSNSDTSARLAALLQHYQQALDAGMQCILDSMLLDSPDGRTRNMQVLTLGAAAAYALSPDGQFAAIGTASANGWQWRWEPGWAGAIRRAIAGVRQQRTAEFVNLPLCIRNEAP